MRTLHLAALSVLLLPAALVAQKPQKTRIADVHVGFRSGRDEVDKSQKYLFKAGSWTPVTVIVQAGDDGFPGGELTVETTDSDDVQNTYTISLPPLERKQEHAAIAYTKPGSLNGEIVVSLRSENQTDLKKNTYNALDLNESLYLAVGGSLRGLRQSLVPRNKPEEAPEKPADNPAAGQDDSGAEADDSNGLNTIGRVAHIDKVEMLPQRWFGYSAVDLLILTTGNPDFVTALINPGEKEKQQREALTEWVRRGGRIVISAGRNQYQLKELLNSLHMSSLPVEVVPGGKEVPRLLAVENWLQRPPGQANLENHPARSTGKIPPVLTAKLKVVPGRETEILIRSSSDKPAADVDEFPLMVRMPFGMGQVTLVAFDLDQLPFARWDGQAEFWKKLQRESGLAPTVLRNPQEGNPAYNPYSEGNPELAAELVRHLQEFPNVSNISFGWVALFIFVYILVVGPLDYLFLKHVLGGRLELTWLTFPAVVLGVSVLAYFTAYALKGNDLLINKTDLVDVDLGGKTAYGHTWFTLFSPRIQHYTVGVEPAAPLWAMAEKAEEKRASSVLVSWMGRPDQSYGGVGRTRSQSLFRRSYAYAPDAHGLEGVPIQVWSMKSFTASWEEPLDPAQLPFSADLHASADFRTIKGTLTNHLPVPLQDVLLIYKGGRFKEEVYDLGNLAPNSPRTLDLEKLTPQPLASWVSLSTRAASKESIIRALIFHEIVPDSEKIRNTTLRDLDESWRLRLKNEVVLFAHIARGAGPADAISTAPVSPSRLWLGKLPGKGETRPELLGTMNQDTFVRIFIPVQGPSHPKE